MRYKILTRISRYLKIKETWGIFFILGIIMMNYPFIHIFDTPRLIFGMPALFLYLFIGWMISICVIYLFVKAIGLADEDKGERS
jgi:Na+-driven multidrug efflux pump